MKLLSKVDDLSGIRLAAINFLVNLSMECSGVFLPLYASNHGASKLQVGFIAASYGLSFFVASMVFSRQSDILGRTRFIKAGLGLSALAYASQLFAVNTMTLLAARAFVGLCLGMCSAAMTVHVYEARGSVGKFIGYGALGWLFGAAVAAVLPNTQALFVMSGLASVAAFALAMKLREETAPRTRPPLFPVSLARSNYRLYLPFFLRQVGAQAVWAIFPLFLAGIGASKTWIAVMDGINMGGQFVLMRFVDRFDPARMFRLGLAASVLMFAAYGVANHYLEILPVQILVAAGYSCLFVGAITFLLKKNPERGASSGLMYSVAYLSAGVGPLIGGAVAQIWGFHAVMFVASGLALAGFLVARGLRI